MFTLIETKDGQGFLLFLLFYFFFVILYVHLWSSPGCDENKQSKKIKVKNFVTEAHNTRIEMGIMNFDLLSSILGEFAIQARL